MAKARDWVVKFVKAEDINSTLVEYNKETNELVQMRTKNSKPEGKKAAADGAIREQKQKFLAICRMIPKLNPVMFDEIFGNKQEGEQVVAPDTSSAPLPA